MHRIPSGEKGETGKSFETKRQKGKRFEKKGEKGKSFETNGEKGNSFGTKGKKGKSENAHAEPQARATGLERRNQCQREGCEYQATRQVKSIMRIRSGIQIGFATRSSLGSSRSSLGSSNELHGAQARSRRGRDL